MNSIIRSASLARRIVRIIGLMAAGTSLTAEVLADNLSLNIKQLDGVTATGQAWEYVYDVDAGQWAAQFQRDENGNGGGPMSDPPDDTEVCPALEEKWDALSCESASNYVANGCGQSGWKGALIPDFLLTAPNQPITDACNNHDLCYSDLGEARNACDANFLDEIKEVCELGAAQRTWRQMGIAQGLHGEPLVNHVTEMGYQCVGQAHIYYGAVVSFGLDAYNNGQRQGVCEAMQELSNQHNCGLGQ